MTNISVTLDTRSHAIKLGERDGHKISALIRLEDDTGYWLFESEDIVAWDTGLGTANKLEKRSNRVKLTGR